MLMDISFDVVVQNERLLVDELCRAASKGVIHVIKESDLCNGEDAVVEILGFNVKFFNLTNYRFVDISMRVDKEDGKFGGSETIVDVMLESIIQTMSAELNVDTDVFADSFENGSVAMYGVDDSVSMKPEGNHWFREDRQWTTNESNEAVRRVTNGENKQKVCGEIEERKSLEREQKKIDLYSTKEPVKNSEKTGFWDRFSLTNEKNK